MENDRRTQTLVQMKIALDRTGALVVEFGYAATPQDHAAGRIGFLQLAMTAKQARELADDLRSAAAMSRQSDDPGHA